MYGTNKTGLPIATPHRELGRAFRRSMQKRIVQERRITIVIVVSELGPDLSTTLSAAIEQSLQDFDVLLVNTNEDREVKKALQTFVEQVEEGYTTIGFRMISTPGASLGAAVQAGIKEAYSSLVLVVKTGDILSPSSLEKLLSLFGHDPYGSVILLEENDELREHLIVENSTLLNSRNILTSLFEWYPFAVRKTVTHEFSSLFNDEAVSPYFVQELFISMSEKGWLGTILSDGSLKSRAQRQRGDEAWATLQKEHFLTEMLQKLYQNRFEDVFFSTRAQSPYVAPYSQGEILIAVGKNRTSPKDWQTFSHNTPEEVLRNSLREYPEFDIGWYLLWNLLRTRERGSESEAVFAKLTELRPDLRQGLER